MVEGLNDVDPEAFVQKNCEAVRAVLRGNDDAFTRACAWVLLERHDPNSGLAQLYDDLKTLALRRA